MDRERRKYARQSVSCSARVFDNRKRLIVKGKTVDISVGGVLILGPASRVPEVTDRVRVEIDLLMPGAVKTREVQRPAVVRRVEAMGEWTAVAVEFEQADEAILADE